MSLGLGLGLGFPAGSSSVSLSSRLVSSRPIPILVVHFGTPDTMGNSIRILNFVLTGIRTGTHIHISKRSNLPDPILRILETSVRVFLGTPFHDLVFAAELVECGCVGECDWGK